MSTMVEQIMKSPNAVKQFKALQDAIAEETRHRHAFYDWIDEDTKAEFINGQIVMHSPVKSRHLNASNQLSSLLTLFVGVKQLGLITVEKAMISLTRNDYEPDICFFSSLKEATFTPDLMLFPAPDFIVEVLSKSTAKNDRGVKKEDYAAHGIQEYWIIDPIKQTIEQYVLISEQDTTYFQPRIYRMDDDIESRVITGFKIPIRAIFDKQAHIEAMKALLGS